MCQWELEAVPSGAIRAKQALGKAGGREGREMEGIP